MTSLRELQGLFIDGVLHDRPLRACALIAGHGLAPERRLAIYRNNAHESFVKTLEAGFPVLARLSGADWFRQTARVYMRAHPSRSGNLHHVGERFAAFLSEQLRDSPFEYFADVAALEWAYQEVLVAADHPPFDVAALQCIAPEQYDMLRYTVHPAVRLVASAYPILAIWKANQPLASTLGDPISLDAGASRVLIVRRDDHVELRELSAAEFALLQAFAAGAAFGEATATMLTADPHADLANALARLMQLGVLVDFESPAQPGAHTYPPVAVTLAEAGAYPVPDEDGFPLPRE